MKTVSVEFLTGKAFGEFGSFRDMLNPMSERLGAPPIEFFPDMIQQVLGNHQAVSYSNCRIGPRDQVINVAECHSSTAEMLMPLDADVLMFFAPACPPDEGFPVDKVRVFLVQKGSMVVIKPGIWHHGPFCPGSEPANILVALPERTYANDTRTIVLEGDDCLLIASPPNP
jgi:ureidoglycolate lyase